MALAVGQPAPDFTLQDQERNPITLSALRGKPVVLAFYPGAFTGGCTREVCSLRDNMEQFNGVDAQVLGISVDIPMVQKAFSEANNLNFPLLSDYRRETATEYDVVLRNMSGLEGYNTARRSVFVVDKAGIIRYVWVAAGDPIPPYEELKLALKHVE